MKQRLQKIISSAGLASRRAAEEMIAQGRVTVNGQVCVVGASADPDVDAIAVDGREISVGNSRIYIMLNKPRGYVTTLSDELGRKTVAELVNDVPERLYPVGRLDLNSEGLIIMTNDGEIANKLMHPSYNVKKTYHAWVEGEQLEAAAERLRQARSVDGMPIGAAEVKILKSDEPRATFSITIGEGRNRQVRNMCTEAGLKVTRLKRVSEGKLKLGTLKAGAWRFLTPAEVRYLREISGASMGSQ